MEELDVDRRRRGRIHPIRSMTIFRSSFRVRPEIGAAAVGWKRFAVVEGLVSVKRRTCGVVVVSSELIYMYVHDARQLSALCVQKSSIA